MGTSRHTDIGTISETTKKATALEEAIELTTGSGKFHIWLLFSCGCCMIAMVGEAFGMAFVSPAAQCEFDMGATEKGVLNGAGYGGMIFSSHLWGYLADTKGRRKILIIALLLDVICSVISSFAPVYWLFLTLRFLNGVFICAPSSVVYAYLGEFYPATDRTKAILYMSIFMSFGGLYQKGIAWLIIPQVWNTEVPWIGINYGSWRVFVITGAIPAFVAMILLCFLPESPKYLFSVGKNEEALKVLRFVYSVNTSHKPEEYPVSHVRLSDKEQEVALKGPPTTVKEVLDSIWSQTKPLFQKEYLLITMLGFIMQFSFQASFNGFALWLPDLFNRLAEFREGHPESSFTICQTMEELKETSTSNPVIQLLKSNSSFDSSSQSTLNEAYNVNNFIQYKGFSNYSELQAENLTDLHTTCTSEVKTEVFRDIMVIRITCMLLFFFAGRVVRYVGRKPLMVTVNLLAGAAYAALLFAQSEWLVVALCATVVAMTAVCVNMLNSIVIDTIPTHLRAMAVCLDMMFGRLGVLTSGMVVGILLEINCASVFEMLASIILLCSVLSLVVPLPKKN